MEIGEEEFIAAAARDPGPGWEGSLLAATAPGFLVLEPFDSSPLISNTVFVSVGRCTRLDELLLLPLFALAPV